MVEKKLDELITYMKDRKVLGYKPPILLLGAGASYEAGIGTMKQLFQFTGVKNAEEFSQHMKNYTEIERYVYLSKFLQNQKPDDVTPGYKALASLLADDYFDIVLSTNFDPLLEDALTNARLWRKNYLLLVNGIIRPERLKLILKEPHPRVKIVKLHGDLFHRYMAWTLEEMEKFIKDITPQLAPILSGRDIFIVGYSFSDKPIRELVVEAGDINNTIWYLHPDEVPETLKNIDRVRAVLGAECKFEKLFPLLAKAFDIVKNPVTKPLSSRAVTAGSESKAVEENKRTIDDLMASVVGLMPDNDSAKTPICSGFILSEPHLIVTEGFSGKSLGDTIKVITADKRVFTTELAFRDKKHPFGPVYFKVPPELNAPGLKLDAGPLTSKMAVRVGVAVGERIGISSGSVLNTTEKILKVVPTGFVEQLIAIDCVVAPGSAGAPVVDAATLAVIGYIVAGNQTIPLSYMYPAYRWADSVHFKPVKKKRGES